MSWHFSQALEEAYSEECSSDGEQFAQWKSMPTAQDDLCSDKMKGTCHRSQFGMMYVPSTDTNGEELLTWFLVVSLAKTLVISANAKESQEREAGCGRKWLASFAKYNRDTHSWKTSQLSLAEEWGPFSVTWPRWGMMHDGECWGDTQPDFVLRESACGLSLLSPVASDAMDLKFRMKSLIRPHRPGANLKEQLAQQFQRRLTATTAEILLAWPEGWTDCAPLATDRFQRWLDSHGIH